jgi:hypothetical protein
LNDLRIGKEVIVESVCKKKIAGLLFDLGQLKEDLRVREEVCLRTSLV